MSELRMLARGMTDKELLGAVQNLMRQKARVVALAEALQIEAEVFADELTERTGRRGEGIRLVESGRGGR